MATQSYPRRLWWALRPLWLWRLLRLLLRSVWLSAAVSLAGWAVSPAAGWPLTLLDWAALGRLAGVLGFGVSAAWPLSTRRLSARLDWALGLRQQIVTAEEVARRRPANYLERELLADADRLLAGARQTLWRCPRLPWGDLELVLAAAAIGYACWLSTFQPTAPVAPVISQADYVPIPAPGTEATVRLPGLPPGLAEGPPAFLPPEEADEAAALNPAAAQQALDTLAEAFSQHDLTASAADALQQGDPGGAAEALRAAADSADQFGQATRAAVAQHLNHAAGQSQAEAPKAAAEMTQAARQMAEMRGTPQDQAASAAAALERMARLVESLEQARQAQAEAGAQQSGSPEGGEGDLEGTGGDEAGLGSTAQREERSSHYTDRLDTAGQPLELPEGAGESGESGLLQGPSTGDPASGPPQSDPFSQAGTSGSGGGPATDPLRHPWRWRHVVQRYFSP
jgi:hypothetical protein